MPSLPVMIWGTGLWGSTSWGPPGAPSAQLTTLQFVDETGVNPLPAGIQATVYVAPYIVGISVPASIGWTQPGGFSNVTAPQLTPCVVVFGGSSQAPTEPQSFFATDQSFTLVQVAPYASPSLSQVGYANFQLAKFPKLWLGDEAKAPGGVAYSIHTE